MAELTKPKILRRFRFRIVSQIESSSKGLQRMQTLGPWGSGEDASTRPSGRVIWFDLKQLERAEKEMTHLGARVQELRRQVKSASAPSSKILSGADIKEFCRQTNLTLDIFTRLVGTSRRAVATWLAGNPPNRANERNLTELSRLFAALAELVPTAQIGSWLENSNSAFEGFTPVQVIERGESDRIWRMIWELRGGNSGD